MEMDQLIKKQIPHSYMYGSANISSLLSFLTSVSTTANVTLSSTDVAVKAITNALLRESSMKSVHVNVCLGVGYNSWYLCWDDLSDRCSEEDAFRYS